MEHTQGVLLPCWEPEIVDGKEIKRKIVKIRRRYVLRRPWLRLKTVTGENRITLISIIDKETNCSWIADFVAKQVTKPVEEDDDPDYICHTDIIGSVSDYLKVDRKHPRNIEYAEKWSSYEVEDLIRAYQKLDLEVQERLWLKHEIVFRVFFLIPYFLKQKKIIVKSWFQDAVQNLIIQILSAMETFDPNRNTKFTQYLTAFFKGGVVQSCRQTNIVHIPQIKNKKAIPEIVIVSRDKDEDDDEQPMYCSYEYDDNFDVKDNDTTPDFEGLVHNKHMLEILEDALSAESNVLSPIERRIIILWYGLFGNKPRTYEQIRKLHKAEGRGCAASRMSQIKNTALKKLWAYFKLLEIKRLEFD